MSDVKKTRVQTGDQVNIENLFDSSRIEEKQDFYKILLYFPFGLVLLIIRVVVGALALLVLSFLSWKSNAKSIIFKTVCKFLGIFVYLDDKHMDENVKLLVANHVCVFDRIVMNVLIPCKMVTNDLNLIDVDTFLKHIDMEFTREELSSEDACTLQKNIQSSSVSALTFPEGATTNGKVGLLQFNPDIFSMNFAVQPVSIRVSLSSFITISPSVIGSTTWSDILWLFFLPCTYFNLRVLPSMVKTPEESCKEFSTRVQNVIATASNLIPTSYTAKDKQELLKHLQTSTSLTLATSNSSGRDCSSETQSVIFTADDLKSEELFQYKVAAKTFGKSPKERMDSYKERKAALIESARLRYFKRHGFT